MKLTDARKLFNELRKNGRVAIAEEHVLKEHKSRGYSVTEILSLICVKDGVLQDTTSRQYLGVRFYWRTQDLLDHDVRFVIEFEEDEEGKLILVVSAGERNVKKSQRK